MSASAVEPKDASAACEHIRKRLGAGAPWEACDAFREAVLQHPGDAALLYWGALAHARAAAITQAQALLDKALAAAGAAPSKLLSEILSLRGRLWKDRFHRARDPASASEFARRAHAEYLAAYKLQRDPFPGINAATLSMITGDRPAARALAEAISTQIEGQTRPRDCWDHATQGEAALLLGRTDQALQSYAQAYSLTPGDAGSVASMRRQVAMLAQVLPDAAAVLQLLRAASVVAFTGQMTDRPGRTLPRFTAAVQPMVRAALRERLSGMHQPVIYTSASCGAELICIEEALDIGAEVNVVLPFDRQEFVRTSVAVGGQDWVERFDRALARVTRVVWATEESHLGDDVLFEHAAQLIEGLAFLRAAQLETQVTPLCVIDPLQPGHLGGARATLQRWQQHGLVPQLVDLGALRQGAALTAPFAPTSAAVEAPAPQAITATPLTPRPQRTLKTMLFADIAGFGRLNDAFAPLFHASFLRIVADQIEACAVKPLESNTWGDALYVVFAMPRDAAEFALRLLARMLEVNWAENGLSENSKIRIALHAGPVFCGFDPIMRRDNYFGSSVTKTARIEPITSPGTVYVSEAFAASLAATGQDEFSFEYMGMLALAKGYGESRIYQLERR